MRKAGVIGVVEIGPAGVEAKLVDFSLHLIAELVDIRQLLDDRLVAMGYEVETETDGLRALKAIGTGRFSGVILDIGIPSVDGMDVLKQIRQDDAHIPIIMVTASGAKESAIRAISLGAQAYLLKPFDVEELRQVMQSFIRTTE